MGKIREIFFPGNKEVFVVKKVDHYILPQMIALVNKTPKSAEYPEWIEEFCARDKVGKNNLYLFLQQNWEKFQGINPQFKNFL